MHNIVSRLAASCSPTMSEVPITKSSPREISSPIKRFPSSPTHYQI